MSSKKYKTIIIVILVVVVALISIRVIFDSNFKDLKNLAQWEKDYKLEHPDATKEEIDQAWNDGMQGLADWTEAYKLEHPGATKEEIDQAFKDAWEIIKSVTSSMETDGKDNV